MKSKISLVLAITMLIGFSSIKCKKDETPCSFENGVPCACGFENPWDSMEWLKSKVSTTLNINVYCIPYKGREYIGIFYGIIDVYGQFYDCNGNIICDFTQGNYSCSDDFRKAILNNSVLIYTNKEDQ